jgi:hypothetical protein
LSTFQKAPPKPNTPLCAPERHLREYGLSLAIYIKAGRLTKGGEDPLFATVKYFSDYFGTNPESTRRAFKRLVNAGWFKPLDKARHYKWVSHDEREKTKKDCKALPDLPHWHMEADPFSKAIFGATGGTVRLQPHWVASARKVAGEEEFLEALRKEFSSDSNAASAGSKFWKVVRQFRNRNHKDEKAKQQPTKPKSIHDAVALEQHKKFWGVDDKKDAEPAGGTDDFLR